ncbi:hypothetical protein M2167_000471 [Streptomyces sp. SPB4]|nr:hypothetical protein [Streptomyces sp. SPB4]
MGTPLRERPDCRTVAAERAANTAHPPISGRWYGGER